METRYCIMVENENHPGLVDITYIGNDPAFFITKYYAELHLKNLQEDFPLANYVLCEIKSV